MSLSSTDAFVILPQGYPLVLSTPPSFCTIDPSWPPLEVHPSIPDAIRAHMAASSSQHIEVHTRSRLGSGPILQQLQKLTFDPPIDLLRISRTLSTLHPIHRSTGDAIVVGAHLHVSEMLSGDTVIHEHQFHLFISRTSHPNDDAELKARLPKESVAITESRFRELVVLLRADDVKSLLEVEEFRGVDPGAFRLTLHSDLSGLSQSLDSDTPARICMGSTSSGHLYRDDYFAFLGQYYHRQLLARRTTSQAWMGLREWFEPFPLVRKASEEDIPPQRLHITLTTYPPPIRWEGLDGHTKLLWTRHDHVPLLTAMQRYGRNFQIPPRPQTSMGDL